MQPVRQCQHAVASAAWFSRSVPARHRASPRTSARHRQRTGLGYRKSTCRCQRSGTSVCPRAKHHGWYDTGDIVRVDNEGFLFILGRLKRFAKVSGEMVSLTAIEEALSHAFPQYGPKFSAVVIARPDESKGEKLVLITNEERLTMD